ncbi:MAG: type II 3-dehydroquinate dehydratase [Clostridiales bacterium]|nr:type II 3-dehydroquinate dehydratase [Clostridiales bacterium]
MKIMVINGPNINMLGIREPNIYGKNNFKTLIKSVKRWAKELGVKVKTFQSNSEGEIITAIQKCYKKFDGIVINPAGYTHTSVAILDALKSVNIPTVEVHISDVASREDFRQISYVSKYAEKTIAGLGIDGYKIALEYLSSK